MCIYSNIVAAASLSVPYGLILRGLDYRGAARHPTHMSNLGREERKVERFKACRAWSRNGLLI